ncbi:hypothetical protein TRIP_B330096 [uncultured Desulfatiglans sp.]|uniref:Uncharacterized protein n=1 Tax=Uncultured Desulfatiglans sp. TaxID=1748965 RepID=A0A653A8E2_UNCDX|nr:hypothetical protein TRIP_B330096 [uncultured Desulfatiglans sp.]
MPIPASICRPAYDKNPQIASPQGREKTGAHPAGVGLSACSV